VVSHRQSSCQGRINGEQRGARSNGSVTVTAERRAPALRDHEKLGRAELELCAPSAVTDPLQRGAGSLLRIDKDAVVYEHDEVVLSVAGHICDSSFAGFGQITTAAPEGALLENLPAI